nr:class II fructose-bisphosphate aldolase [uncultured Solibaculum sp.]
MLVNLNDVLLDARKNHYGVGLFNTVNLEMAKGVLQAAEETRSPVIIGSAEVLLPYASLQELSDMLVPMAKRASVPVVLHFDHGLTVPKIREAIKLGFTSIMYDCSNLSFGDNCREVATMTKEAHQQGITVEAELGHVGANAGDSDQSVYTQPEEAMEYVARTGVDALAVAIGSAHGAYKSKPQLQFDLLKQLREQVNIPLVLHGGSGLSDEDFKKSIADGISKVNIFTDINFAAAKAAHDGYRDGLGMTDLIEDIIKAVKEATIEKMRIFGSVGKA